MQPRAASCGGKGQVLANRANAFDIAAMTYRVRMGVSVLAGTLLMLAWPAAAGQAEPILGAEAEVTRVAAQARIAFGAGRYRDALIMLRDVHAFAAAELGPDHPVTLQALTNIATIQQMQGDTADALPNALRAAGGLERALGPDHPETLNALANLAQLHVTRGERAAAEPLLRRVLSGRSHTLGAAHAATLEALLELAVFLNRDGRLREIKTELERGAETARTSFGAESTIASDLTDAAAAAARPRGTAREDRAS